MHRLDACTLVGMFLMIGSGFFVLGLSVGCLIDNPLVRL